MTTSRPTQVLVSATAPGQATGNSATEPPREPVTHWTQCTAGLCELSNERLGKLDIAAINLACAELLPGSEGIEYGACMAKLDEWARLVRLNTEHWLQDFTPGSEEHNCTRNRFRMSALVTVLQKYLGVRYYLPFNEGEYDGANSQNLFIHGLLSGHGGTCATMPVLYLAIGRRLRYPLKLVEAYGHFFARWDEPGVERFNIECTCNGFVVYDDLRGNCPPQFSFSRSVR